MFTQEKSNHIILIRKVGLGWHGTYLEVSMASLSWLGCNLKHIYLTVKPAEHTGAYFQVNMPRSALINLYINYICSTDISFNLQIKIRRGTNVCPPSYLKRKCGVL